MKIFKKILTRMKIMTILSDRVSILEQNGIPGVRDFFATSALSILATGNYTGTTADLVAKFAYKIADAMLLERDKINNVRK